MNDERLSRGHFGRSTKAVVYALAALLRKRHPKEIVIMVGLGPVMLVVGVDQLLRGDFGRALLCLACVAVSLIYWLPFVSAVVAAVREDAKDLNNPTQKH